MKYNAFISYRHAPLDMEIAKKVHTGLETYKIPKSVQKRLGIKKIERVFRDQEELPIGSNLSDNIGEALKESEHLIVICSPRTPESEWVRKEIETFIKLHGRENVLAVLVEGEPNESFPDLLLNDENGNPVEPLAADVRGETAGERNKKFKTEILRLVAPVIGCNYDDLRQRHRERIVRRTVSLVSAAAGIIAIAGIAFGLYHANVADKMTTLANEKAELADEKTQLADEILEEYKLKQENQSRFFAKEALSLASEGNRKDAALVAIAGLPGPDNERPYVPDAEYALSQVLHAYDIGEDMAYDRVLEHDLTPSDEKLSTDRKHLLTRDNGYNVYVWDTETWELVLKVTPEVGKNNYLEKVKDVFADSDGLYILSEYSLSKYSFAGAKIFSFETENYIDGFAISAERGRGYLLIDNSVVTVNLSKGTEISTIEFPVDGSVYSQIDISRDEEYLLFTYKKDDTERIDIASYNIDKNVFNLTRLSDDYVLEYCYTALGNLAVLSCNQDFVMTGVKKIYLDVVNPQTGRIMWSREVPCSIRSTATFDLKIKAHTYESYTDESVSEIVIAVEAEAFTFNELTSKLVTSMNLPGDTVTLDLRRDNAVGFVSDDNGRIYTINFHEGTIYKDNTIDVNSSIRQLIIMDGVLAVRSAYSSVVQIMKYHTAGDLTEIADYVDYFATLKTAPLGSDYFVTRRNSDDNYLVISKDGKLVSEVELDSTYTILDGFRGDNVLLFSYEAMYTVDSLTGKVDKATYTEMGSGDEKLFHGYISENGKYAVIWDNRHISVIDTEQKKVILDSESSASINNAVVTEDGKTVFVSASDMNLIKLDVATKDEMLYDNDALRQVSDAYSLGFIAASHDGKAVAMSCMDGKLRVLNAADGSVIDEVPFYARSHCAIYFMPDDKNILLQGDDLKASIRNIEDKTYTNSFNPTFELKRPTNAGDGYIAVCDATALYFLETETYGLCASVLYGCAYIPSEKSFIISSSRKLYRTAYKDYKALIEEAGRQFPGAELTDEEKVKYNID
ncbi:MAG: toll/interleukin-1 receptor domain-containing protein [Lachnospiraceae bacterium]|nr:toll/interleukin-1 receptor domain-containing protein [Lachnospiraceae bacterium]